ncbi:hypothetical protein [Nocardioides sp.]|uniref:hypothetical protein n=1 Tax=Nocardioides sp. TaxID=35761 RepID=UPI0027332D61|nr:hypothetical protein [Nocardioides sp.]MDP3890348.1 hypothetical protein [Nocardioides sp.]
MRLRVLTVLLPVAGLLLAACGSDPGPRAIDPVDDPGGSDTAAAPPAAPTTMPTSVPASDGEVHGFATVMDTGTGPELCLGGVMESYPPQCGGPRIEGFDWADQDGMFDQEGEIRWGLFALTGTFDGTTFTVTRPAVPGALYDPIAEEPDEDPLTTPCPEPEGGWQVVDPARTDQASMEAVFAEASRLDDYAGAWMDQSPNPADPTSDPEAMNDPTLVIVNVTVTGDPAAAEADLREVWGGMLCVSRAEHTEAELSGIQQELGELPGLLSSWSGRDRVHVEVVFDDGSLQAWVDETYGDGVVVVSSALRPA